MSGGNGSPVFENVEVFTGIPKVTEQSLSQQVTATTGVSVEQTRAIAETQASMAIARLNPRDENTAYLKIMKACKRKTLAEQALYAYRRGGNLVSGPSIRLAEVLIRSWGNAKYGFNELSRDGDESQVEAYCWDLETNVKASRRFIVKHYRDTRNGAKSLNAERDIYEHIASQAQRRVRACILEILPGDITDAAVEACQKSLTQGDGTPIEDRIRKMVVSFDELGISKDDLEGFLQHTLTDSLNPAELVRLQQIHRSMKDGVASKEDFFKPILKTEPETSEHKSPSSETKQPDTEKKTKKKTSFKQEKIESVNPFQTELDILEAHGTPEEQQNGANLIEEGNEPKLMDLVETVKQRAVKDGFKF